MAAPFAMFGGARHSFRHHRRNAVRPSLARRDDAQAERSAMAGALTPPAATVFWPDAPADLTDYLFFPKGKSDRFWSYGYGAIVEAAFATSDVDDPRTMRSRRVADGDSAAAARTEADPAPPCDSAASDAEAAIARIEQAIEPSAQQREVLEKLRTALGQAVERIKATCPAAKPATIAQRLKAVQDRIWAMRDALLTIRLPLENFYASLRDEQHWRLHRDETDSRETAAKPAEGRAQMCGGPAAAEDPLRAIERAMAGDEQQRAGFQALRQTSGAMAQLIANSCPEYPLLGHMGRFAAAADRLDVMLFVVMAMSPALESFYGSLDDNQRRGLGFAMRQRRPPSAADGF
jgi:LTXXQ motif family protein